MLQWRIVYLVGAFHIHVMCTYTRSTLVRVNTDPSATLQIYIHRCILYFHHAYIDIVIFYVSRS